MYINDTTLQRKSYALEIDMEVFKKLLNMESWNATIEEMNQSEQFNKQLEKLGAMDVDYNGHFGNNIYFTIDAENSSKTLQKIKKYIEKSLSKLNNTGNLI